MSWLNPDFLAGITAGTVTTAALYPLDVVKVRFQVADGRASATALRYTSLRDAFSTITRTESWRGLYKGMFPALLGSAASWGSYFFFYEKLKTRTKLATHTEKLVPTQNMLCALQAGMITVCLTNPIWLIKTRLQLQVEAEGGYRGTTDAVRQIVAQEGLAGLYRGFVPALLLTSHGMVQFGVYEELKHLAKHYTEDEHPHSGLYFGMGLVSKVAATSVTYPWQVIKSRLQQRQVGERYYNGFIDAVRKTFRNEGTFGFYKGMSANLLRVAPASALTLVVYEKTKVAFTTLLE